MIKDFQPVMRHFFTEQHRNPTAWFAMRLNYARSVAVTSMVGHMVGLGDRHCSNILLDQSTGELVHIDFGVVFEEVRKLWEGANGRVAS
jgi:ataxia telangiectasia mutated family protein